MTTGRTRRIIWQAMGVLTVVALSLSIGASWFAYASPKWRGLENTYPGDNAGPAKVATGKVFDNRFYGSVTDMGETTKATVHFEYRLNGNSYAFSTPPQSVAATGNFSAPVPNNLFNKRLYHFRAVATSSVGASVGSDETFTFSQSSNPYVEKIVSDMQNGWVGTGTGTVSLDSAYSVIGGQSLKITTQGDGTTTNATLNLSSIIDTVNSDIGVWLRVSDTGARMPALNIYTSSDNFTTKWNRWPLARTSHAAIENPDQWVKRTMTFLRYATGAPNNAAINSIRIVVADDGSGPVSVWLGEVFTVAKPSQAIVTFTFDDSWQGVYDYAVPKLAESKSAGTTFNIIGDLDRRGRLTLAELREMQDKYGWDISGHAYSHHGDFSSLNEAALRQEYSSMQSFFQANNITGGQYYAPPGGYFSDNLTMPIIKEYMKATRSVEAYGETYPAADWYRLRTINLGSDTPLADVEYYVDIAVANKQWLIFELHQVSVDASMGATDFQVSKFNVLVDYINSKGVIIKPVSWVYNQYLDDTNPVSNTSTSGASLGTDKNGFISGNSSGTAPDAVATSSKARVDGGVTPTSGNGTDDVSQNAAIGIAKTNPPTNTARPISRAVQRLLILVGLIVPAFTGRYGLLSLRRGQRRNGIFLLSFALAFFAVCAIAVIKF